MSFIYSLLLTLALLLLLPFAGIQALLGRKRLSNLRERLGMLPREWRHDGRPSIWLHAVSVGEALSSLPLLDGLRRELPDHRLIVSTTTATGQAVARARLKAADGFCYFPLDWRFSVRRALTSINPQLVVLMESELWPNFLDECRTRKIPVVVANGRISDRSYARSRRFGWFVRRLYSRVSHFACQSAIDAERALSLGARPEQVVVCGNIKYDLVEPAVDEARRRAIEEFIAQTGLDRAQLIVAGSTSEGEERMLLDAFAALRKRPELESVRMLIAPRHPERFDEVARMIAASGFSHTRRSQGSPSQPVAAEIVLLDTIGELSLVYRYAAVVFIGGSLVAKGGHNILEPALYGRPVVVGPHMENFRDMAREFRARDALLQIEEGTQSELQKRLEEALARLLIDRESASRLGANACATIEANRGATARHLALIREAISR